MSGWWMKADWIVAIATVAALLVAAWQLRMNSRVSGENFARQIWLEYLRLGLSNPDLGETPVALKSLRMSTVERLVSGQSIGSQRYLWFLTVMLDTCENGLKYLPAWEPTVEEQLRFHKEALRVLWPRERQFYSTALDRIISRVLAEPAE